MQATSIQLVVLLTVSDGGAGFSGRTPGAGLASIRRRCPSSSWAMLEADGGARPRPAGSTGAAGGVGGRVSRRADERYFADGAAIDVLTDTTERSPTYCTPSFRKFDDVPPQSRRFCSCPKRRRRRRGAHHQTPAVVRGVGRDGVRELVLLTAGPNARTLDRIGCAELLRFRVGLDGLTERRRPGVRWACCRTRAVARAEADGFLQHLTRRGRPARNGTDYLPKPRDQRCAYLSA